MVPYRNITQIPTPVCVLAFPGKNNQIRTQIAEPRKQAVEQQFLELVS